MTRFLSIASAIAALTASSTALAEPLPGASSFDEPLFEAPSFHVEEIQPPSFSSTYDPTWLAAPSKCAPGTKLSCSCDDGKKGTQTCEPSGARFSLCACASISVHVPTVVVPPVAVVPVRVNVPKRRPQKRSSGLGMLIGGSITLAIGTGNLIWGIERVRDKGSDPLGIVMISTGGVAMATGLPLTIVGIVFLATRGLDPDKPAMPRPTEGEKKSSRVTFSPTPSGFALTF